MSYNRRVGLLDRILVSSAPVRTLKLKRP